MRSFIILNKILIDHISEIRQKYCIGCEYNHPSQTRHIVCLTNIDELYYRYLALDSLLVAGHISPTEYIYLKNKNTVIIDEIESDTLL